VDGSSGDAFLDVAAAPTARLDRLHEVLLVFQQRGGAASRISPAPTAAGTSSPVVEPVPNEDTALVIPPTDTPLSAPAAEALPADPAAGPDGTGGDQEGAIE
jgi:hypothetical protein